MAICGPHRRQAVLLREVVKIALEDNAAAVNLVHSHLSGSPEPVGSSLDRTGGLGVRLWEHHFKHTVPLDELQQI